MAAKALPNYIAQDICSLIAVYCWNNVMMDKSDDEETRSGQELPMEKCFMVY
jgi:hypothetical protein